MDDRERNLLRLRGEVVSEHFTEETVHDGVQPFFHESIPVLLGLPYVDVAKAAFGALEGEMYDEPLWGHFAETVGDAAVLPPADRPPLDPVDGSFAPVKLMS